MKHRIYFVLLLMIFTTSLTFSRNSNSVGFNTGILVPFNNDKDTSSLVVGGTYHFWGIFDFMANTYFDINSQAEELYQVLNAPDLFSFGVGLSIPLGGFYFKTDSQQFIQLSNGSFNDYFGSYKGGIGFNVDKNVELEFYYRHFYNFDNLYNYEETDSFIGFGIIFKE